MLEFLKKTNLNLKKTLAGDKLGTDKFADKISIQLKSAANSAILEALGRNEERFLSSILQRSYFQIDSLTITPEDRQTSLDLEEFFRVHEAIDPQFKQSFFSQILQTEYRSRTGARAKVARNFLPSVQLTADSISEPTAEERFQVSLRGQRLPFRAHAILSGPFRVDTEPTNQHLFMGSQPAETSSNALITRSLRLCITDSRGTRHTEIFNNTVLGRGHDCDQREFISVHGTYVSRRHLLMALFDAEVYLALHGDSSLSAILNNSVLLKDNQIYRLDRHQRHKIVLGPPKTGLINEQVKRDTHDFPIIEFGPSVESTIEQKTTPVPMLR